MEFAAYPMLGKIKKAVKVLVPLWCIIMLQKFSSSWKGAHIWYPSYIGLLQWKTSVITSTCVIQSPTMLK